MQGLFRRGIAHQNEINLHFCPECNKPNFNLCKTNLVYCVPGVGSCVFSVCVYEGGISFLRFFLRFEPGSISYPTPAPPMQFQVQYR